jgi:hypothetical protein
MALKNLSSLYDLVQGNKPVSEMENQQGGTKFDLGPNSTIQQDSLPEIPIKSQYQDLNGEPGPQFDLREDSTLQEDNLVNLQQKSKYSDLNGAPFGNGLFYNKNNPGRGEGKMVKGEDLHINLLTKAYKYSYGNSKSIIPPSPSVSDFQDLDGGLPQTGKYEDNGPADGQY